MSGKKKKKKKSVISLNLEVLELVLVDGKNLII
jgi:hypothetical protein